MKDFDGWHPLKRKLDKKHNPPTCNEREIWWCSVGVNIGYEVFGKDGLFTRPVLILRKFSRYTFLGVPMTTNSKDGYFRYPYKVKGKDGCLLLDQTRTYDSRRLTSLMVTIPRPHFEEIKRVIKTRFNF